ncbi:MAG: YicC family protein [Mesorhizobium sp.]|uniref:YicC/YloC family endoribonuclease n=1 Tax=unclassified Mesorhizobium TaxID=325217 RepID=UPI000FCB9E65|nr:MULTISPECIES: YicC/YloC family endoribonuclease [unclassified Mesorhizobium]RUX46478.1 YicC family protein [Mesorhizobium sp. M4A.F.Ca.ET.050.02.1.1]RVC47111.1 YicC family protein [Mesorhizobium sp. M4A.F.Ca.ET.090.04.2.1]RVC81755.1 YicC family protein [Mesorhizobium sp. M4A.F.Ca.ET.022.05.2.1]RVD43591.1 YicC family protein [Mesorhizobium sp. M4A.F.Ca.ET.020.02.1.1]RWC14220.1 MAG: YicC family protein [Mesorhizobium sp.]
MNLQSMTGFARAVAEYDGNSIAWEVKSVNGKSIEVRLRLPQGFERLEPAVRQTIQKRFSRGNFQATLTVGRAAGHQVQPVVNEAFLKDLAGLAKRLQEQFGVAPATADGLLALRGVLDIPETIETEEARAALDGAILASLETVLTGLEMARQGEGAALRLLLAGHIDAIEALTLKAEADPSREPAAIRDRIAEQVRLLMDASANLDASRLHQEAAFLATKADIREEIDRLKTHVASARVLLANGGAIGRKLDFLAQEFNRESNTLCSKSNAAAVTAIGLELKAVVDQFREQVQNLE